MAVERGQVVLGGGELEATTRFFTDLGFRLLMIMPADRPRLAELEGFGLVIRLDTGRPATSTTLRLPVDDVPEPTTVTAPNGTTIEFVAATPGVPVPPLRPSFVLSRAAGADWTVGRAGMGYRDLIPDRQGGRFIASHIHIPTGGLVPDYVHHHAIRFQMIYCYRGWARLVYEDQGPPFRFEAGDCVLQPPHIRHQVLETSSAFDVVEISCPAEHETLRDHELRLPTEHRIDRTYGGQRFVHHRSATASWRPAAVEGYDARDLGIGEATGGLAGARVIRPRTAEIESRRRHDGELLFLFVLQGGAVLDGDAGRYSLGPADSVVLAPGEDYRLGDSSADLELLEVSLPA